jgi:hypothetical protein
MLSTFSLSQLPCLGEFFEGAVVGFFRRGGKAAAGEFAVFQVRLDAVAAEAAFSAGTVSAAAVIRIFLLFAFHSFFPTPFFFFLS